jgi:hypothetical protein
MIIELLLIGKLLDSKTVEFKSTPTAVSPAKTPTPGSNASLGGPLGFFGKTVTITQPVDISSYTMDQATKDYVAATKDVKTESISAKLSGGRL